VDWSSDVCSSDLKAAVSLRERIIQTAGDEALGVTAATFHGLCASILREEHEQLGLPSDFTIASEEQRDTLVKRIQEESGNRRSGLGSYIETRKRFLLAPGETAPEECISGECAVSVMDIPEADAELERLYARYREELRSAGSLDFDDLIAETARLFARNPETLVRYRNRFHAIFVDEYQDVNFAQYLLIRFLAFSGQDNQMLWVIGDPNQAIYGFRGADKRFIDRFLTDYPTAETFRLTRSFRCGEGIVTAAGLLMNAQLRGTAETVRLFRSEYPSESAEAEGIARRVARLIGGTSFFAFDSGLIAGDDAEPELAGLRDCAILLRTMTLAPPFIAALGTYGIPCLASGEKPWWEAEPISTLLKALREALQNEDALGHTKPAEAIETQWKRMILPKASRQREEAVRESLDRLLGIASLYGDLGEFLDALSVGDASGGVELDREGVRIMTIHASKGLEFEHVFVPALEEGLLPFTVYGVSEDQIEEEKRLLYVAMTRAKRGLYLSYANKRVFQGRNLGYGRSRFLDALESAVPDYQEKRKQKPANLQMNLF
jgi:superfamily I DNA/RNA helicase